MTLTDFHTFCRSIKSSLARGLVTGLLGPMIVSGLAKRPPSGPSSGVTTGSTPGAPPHPSPSSLGASVDGPVVTLLLRSVRGLTTKRAGLPGPSSLPLLIAGAALIQGCAGGQMRARSPEFEVCYLKADAESLERYKRECAGYESISECPSGIVEPIEVEHQVAQEACK